MGRLDGGVQRKSSSVGISLIGMVAAVKMMRGTPEQISQQIKSMRLTSAQHAILKLCGYRINDRWLVTEYEGELKQDKMREGRKELKALLSKDLGDHIMDWHLELKRKGLYGVYYSEERFDRIIEDIAAAR